MEDVPGEVLGLLPHRGLFQEAVRGPAGLKAGRGSRSTPTPTPPSSPLHPTTKKDTVLNPQNRDRQTPIGLSSLAHRRPRLSRSCRFFFFDCNSLAFPPAHPSTPDVPQSRGGRGGGLTTDAKALASLLHTKIRRMLLLTDMD